MTEEEHPSAQASSDEVVATIAQQLGETEQEPLDLLRKIVKKLGPELSLAFLKETLDREAQGGLVLPDGSRRRTPGGVFFYLVRTQGPKRVRFLFWRQQQKTGQETVGQAGQPALPPFSWADRVTVLEEIGTEKGTISAVKITLIGRPGKIIERGTCVVTSMQTTKVPSLPKGLPTPPNTVTTYTLYVASKQWRKVAEAIKDQEDVLIIEGFPQLDSQTGSIAVFATTTTTKKLQAAVRQAQQEQAP